MVVPLDVGFLPTFRNHQVQDDEQFRLFLSGVYTSVANAVNVRQNGLYQSAEFQSGQTWVDGSPVFRKVFTVGAIAAGGTSGPIPTGITTIKYCTNIYGTVVTNVPDFRPIPHASVTANANIEVIVTTTTYTINVGAASPNVVSGYLVLEYVKV
jgi:hypothetical protein